MQAGPTNAATDGRNIVCTFGIDAYREFQRTLAVEVSEAVGDRWGPPESDPFFLPRQQAFAIPAFSESARPVFSFDMTTTRLSLR